MLKKIISILILISLTTTISFSRIVVYYDEPLDNLIEGDIELVEETEVYFSPGNCEKEIIEELQKAKETIDIALYYFTSKNLTNILLKKHKDNITIRIYLDSSQEKLTYSKATKLEDKGIKVKYENNSGLMHNKFCIIDNKTIITGSYNWTKRAESINEENIVIIHDKKVSEKFTKQFNKYWGY